MTDDKKQPAVSIIVPAYNAASTIGSAIESVLDQTFQSWELIIVDDCSTDQTGAVVREYDDPRIVLISLRQNVRVSAARNVGLERARGSWLAYLDADDAWDNRRLAILMDLVEPKTFISDVIAIARPNRDGKLVADDPAPAIIPDNFEILENYRDYLVSPGRKFAIFPADDFRAAVNGFPEDGSGGDWAFAFAKWFASGLRGKIIRWPGYFYRVTGTHDSSRLKAIEEEFLVDRQLSQADWLPEDARALIGEGLPGIRRRLLVAALRERNGRAFLHYASRHPEDMLHLPVSAVRFAVKRLTL